jgi:hypothetical protein
VICKPLFKTNSYNDRVILPEIAPLNLISGFLLIMRALILSDIHANLEALEAVIEDAQGQGGFDTIW